MQRKGFLRYFSPLEWGLWLGSSGLIILSFLCSGEFYALTLLASLVGVTSLIFIAKGNVAGQILTVAFCLAYAVISVRFRYWGEAFTYLFMSLPAALFACVSWIKHPAQTGKREVEIARMTGKKWIVVSALALLATLLFFFVLRYFHTANLPLSTLSVTTSFFAAALLFLRSPYYALAYAANDIVLIALWMLATIQTLSYLPMVVCFAAFLCNDVYGFINWRRMQVRQRK